MPSPRRPAPAPSRIQFHSTTMSNTWSSSPTKPPRASTRINSKERRTPIRHGPKFQQEQTEGTEIPHSALGTPHLPHLLFNPAPTSRSNKPPATTTDTPHQPSTENHQLCPPYTAAPVNSTCPA